MNPGSKENTYSCLFIQTLWLHQGSLVGSCGKTSNSRFTWHQWRLTLENTSKVQQIEYVEAGMYRVETSFCTVIISFTMRNMFVQEGKSKHTHTHISFVHMVPTPTGEYSYHSKQPLPLWRMHLKGYTHHGIVKNWKKWYPLILILYHHMFHEHCTFYGLETLHFGIEL